jgi:predicted acylesterase/phospholipase RssA
MSSYNLNAGIPTVFRSYQGPANQGPDCSIWEALCATMAHPDLFKSVNIGEPPLMQSFVGGGLGCNNPIMHVLAEVKALYPEQHVASIISIGAGHTRTIRIPKPTLLQRVLSTNVIRAIQDIATDSERVAQEMEIRFHGMVNVYFRLSVDQGLQKVKQSEWERLGEVTAHANAYTRRLEINQKLEKAAQAITERRPIISTVRIGTRKYRTPPSLH